MNIFTPTNNSTLADLIDGTGDFLTTHWKNLLIIVLLTALPLGLLDALIAFIGFTHVSDDIKAILQTGNFSPTYLQQTFILSKSSLTVLALQSTSGIGAFLCNILTPLAILSYAREVLLHKRILTAKEAYLRAFPFFLIALGTVLLITVFVLFGLVFMIIPAIIIGIYTSLCLPIILWEGKSFMENMKYSFQLIQGHWWKTLGYTIVVGIIGALISSFLITVLSIPFAFIGLDAFTATITKVVQDFIQASFILFQLFYFLSLQAKLEQKTAQQKEIL